MPPIKSRMKHVFKGPVTVAGSMAVNAPLDVNSSANFLGTEVHSGVITAQGSINFAGGLKTFNAQTRVNTPRLAPAGSANNQWFGRTSIASNAISVVVSTTAIKSNSVVFLTPILTDIAPTGQQASGTIYGALCVSTIRDGAFFTIALLGGVASGSAVFDAAWEIKHVA